MKNEGHGGPHRSQNLLWSFPSIVNMRTMVGIDLVKSLVNCFFKNFDVYITGSLGPAGSQIRKIKILNNFFYFAFCVADKNSA